MYYNCCQDVSLRAAVPLLTTDCTIEQGSSGCVGIWEAEKI